MSQLRTKTLLAAWILAFLAAVPASGQALRDMQAFAPVDMMSPYGGGYRANEGFFFTFDGLVCYIGTPDRALIGDATTRRVVTFVQDVDPPVKTVEYSTHDTGFMGAPSVVGQRYDFGYVEGHHGYLFSGFTMPRQNQRLVATDVHVSFDDAPFGDPPSYHLQGYTDTLLTAINDLPVRFDELRAENRIDTWGVELNYLYRTHPRSHGGILELFLGARYLDFDETFSVEGFEYNDPPAFGLGDSYWSCKAENRIVGPQIGGRWFRRTGRWTWSTEGRFFAGFNTQNVHVNGLLGSKLDPGLAGALQVRNMSPTSFNHTHHFENEWSPAAELRVDLKYQLTRAIAARVGWTGMWIDSIARAAGMIDYSLGENSVMGITNRNTQGLFMHAFTFGLEMNR
jgi:hypothetical protein